MEVLQLKTISEKNLVAQANALIKARYKITRNEEMLLKAMMSLIEPSDKEILTFSVRATELARTINMDVTTALREFDKITTRLMSRVIKLETENGWRKFQWVSEADLDDGIVSLKFHDKLKPYLLALGKTGHFTQYRLEDINYFRSAYTSRVYEMLLEAHNKKKNSVKISVTDFRNQILGDGKQPYSLFKDFKRYVILIAKKELEEKNEDGYFKSKLSFVLHTQRTDRKITDLEFKIVKQETAKKTKVIDIDANEPEPETDLQKTLLKHGISKANVSIFLSEHDEKYLLEKIEHFEKANAKNTIGNSGGWLTKAIKDDWKEKDAINAQRSKEVAQEKRAELEAEQNRKQQEQKKRKAENQVKDDFLESLSSSAQDELLGKIKADPDNGSLVSGLDSGIGRSMLFQHIPDYKEKVEALL